MPETSEKIVVTLRLSSQPERRVTATAGQVSLLLDWVRTCEDENPPKQGRGYPASLWIRRVYLEHAEWCANRTLQGHHVQPLEAGDTFPSITAFASRLGVSVMAIRYGMKRGYDEASKVGGLEYQFHADERDV